MMYPALSPIIDMLSQHNITAIFVGGCVRDYLLGQKSLDIDIELYGASDTLQILLEPFGKVNHVGKSFGVTKLSYQAYKIDFSVPRTEIKIQKGHKGFEVQTHQELDFALAAKRRDFTINAMGYNPATDTLLDFYHGQDDLNAKKLRCVDPATFVEDPLRILRAVQFVARFELTCDPALINLCATMISHGALEELPKERIHEEIKKLLLLSAKPSLGLALLEQMGGSYLFAPPCQKSWRDALKRCDAMALQRTLNEKNDLPLMLASLLLDVQNPQSVLERINFHRTYMIATLHIIDHAQKYGELSFPPKPLLMGRDLITLGVKPSIEFSAILAQGYDAQMRGTFVSKQEGLAWLKNQLTVRLVTPL
jgi:tRNA nucleotidyltransferase (CCA-adding enzyme)